MLHVLNRRRQSGEGEGKTSELCVRRRGWRRVQPLGGEAFPDKGINGMIGPGGNFRLHGLFKGPMLSPLRPLGDPATQHFFLRIGEGFAVRVGRRHQFVLVGRDDTLPDLARLKIGRDDGTNPVAFGLGGGFLVETEIGFAMTRVGTVAVEAPIREDGENLAAEVHRRTLRRSGQ